MKTVNVWFGRRGNGLTVAGSSRSGLPLLAHISNSGGIKWYVRPEKLPDGVRNQIEFQRAREEENYRDVVQRGGMRFIYRELDYLPQVTVEAFFALSADEEKLSFFLKTAKENHL